MEKRLVLAIALSVLVVLTFQYFMPQPTQGPVTGKPGQQIAPVSVKEPEAISPVPPERLAEEKTIRIDTNRYILAFSNIGGSLKDIKLKDFKDANSNEPMGLVNLADPKEYIFALSSISLPTSLNFSEYEPERKGDVLTYTLNTKDFKVTKEYFLPNYKYIIELEVFVKNISDSPKEFSYTVIGGSGVSEPSIQDRRFVEVVSKINDKILNFKRPKMSERIINPGLVNWAALKNKYFSLILKPFVNTRAGFYSANRDGHLVVGVEPETVIIQPGASIQHKFLLYAGPSQTHILKETGYGFEESINYGFFGPISKVLISSMRFFYKIVHNWGISVILLSVFLNIILFPLTIKSFKSMLKMQELHPQMEKIKIQHKDNPQKMNKEMMELYKKYNINPLSGCLPMLLQMPIFIALYQALMKSIELRSATFLWIKDMSMPDAILLPLSFPIIGNSINILPIIMVIAMIIQQKISTKSMGSAVTEEQKQQQKMMLIIMPIAFGFIFYNMPSGLVLYWVINTVLTIAEQALILKNAEYL